jgi:MoxR-like ATPase
VAADPEHPLAKDAAWRESLLACLGQEAIDLEGLAERKRASLGGDAVPMGLGDFFFDPKSPLHPDFEDEDEEDDED